MLNFVPIPTDVFQRLKGKSKAYHTLSVMAAIRNVRTNETRFVSKPVIAELTGISTRHTYRLLDELEAMGLIECIAERRGEYMWKLPFLTQTEQKTSATHANVKQFMTEAEMEADTQRMLKEMNMLKEASTNG